MLKQKYQFKNYNWILISAVLILSGMGVMFINSADSSYTSKQLVGLIFCAGIMLLLSVVNFNFVCGFMVPRDGLILDLQDFSRQN